MRKSFDQSRETKAIVDLFGQMMIDQQMTFAEASRAVEFAITSSSGCYQSARKIAERDHRIYIGSIRGAGFFRGNKFDMYNSGRSYMFNMRRTSNKLAKRMLLAIENNLPDAEAREAGEMLSRARIIHDTAEPMRARSNRPMAEKHTEAPRLDRHLRAAIS